MLVLKIILLCLNLMEGNIWFILAFICRSCQDMSFSFPLQNPFNPLNNLKRQALYQAFLPSFPLLSLMCALQANSLWQCFFPERDSFWFLYNNVMYISHRSFFWVKKIQGGSQEIMSLRKLVGHNLRLWRAV